MLTTDPLIATPLNLHERLELANQLFREFHTQCFWHSPRDLVIPGDLIPFVVKGLRKHGGRRGFLLAGKLQPEGAFVDVHVINERIESTPELQEEFDASDRASAKALELVEGQVSDGETDDEG